MVIEVCLVSLEKPNQSKVKTPGHFILEFVTIFRDVFLHFLRLFLKQGKSISSDFYIQRHSREILDKV